MQTSSLKRRGAELGSGFQAAINSTNTAYAKTQRAYITRKAIPGKYLTRRGQQRKGLGITNLDNAQFRLERLSSSQLIELSRSSDRSLNREFVPESKAEPDYGGAIAPTGRAIVYDAKTTQRDRLDLDNLHPHQIFFLEQMAAIGAVSGFLVEFASFRKVFFLPIQIVTFYLSSQKRKSIPFRFCEESLVVVEPGKGMLIFDYLTAIEKQEQRYSKDYSGFKMAS